MRGNCIAKTLVTRGKFVIRKNWRDVEEREQGMEQRKPDCSDKILVIRFQVWGFMNISSGSPKRWMKRFGLFRCSKCRWCSRFILVDLLRGGWRGSGCSGAASAGGAAGSDGATDAGEACVIGGTSKIGGIDWDGGIDWVGWVGGI